MTNDSYKKIDLFTSPVFSFRVDPESFNKQEIVERVNLNYQAAPYRNTWDESSNLHHYYENWNPNEFNFTSLIYIYSNIVKKIIDDLAPTRVNFNVKIENITAYDIHQHMSVHHHHFNNNVFAGVHYISVPENSSPLTFVNPLVFSQYSTAVQEVVAEKLNWQTVDFSSYHYYWDYHPKEDEVIIFPSYLKHQVNTLSKKVNKETDIKKIRIAIVFNVEIFPSTV